MIMHHCGAAKSGSGNKKSAGEALFVGCFDRLQTGAGEGIRTLDPDLGKVVLYP